MGWTWDALRALPADIYDALVADLNTPRDADGDPIPQRPVIDAPDAFDEGE